MSPICYAGNPLYRNKSCVDENWVEKKYKASNCVVIPYWQESLLCDSKEKVIEVTRNRYSYASLKETLFFLGEWEGRGYFAQDFSHLNKSDALEQVGASQAISLRKLYPYLDPKIAAIYGFGRGLAYWHRSASYCSWCGGKTSSMEGGHIRQCQNGACKSSTYPRIQPAVIVLVESPETPSRCLLACHKGAKSDNYSILAGYVEIGESLEDAVRREVKEETGVQIGDVHYVASQPWPFPANLMVGYRAKALSIEIVPDPCEIDHARWFSRSEVKEKMALSQAGKTSLMFHSDSIERQLVEAWLHGEKA